ncbi:hypothetical protein J2S97_000701 [Arthrobacter oryzae]|nr:hypothetical protein [Arthrobacter oryzae]
MTLGDTAEPYAHINDLRVGLGDRFLRLRPSNPLFRYGFVEYDSKHSIAGPFLLRELTSR